MYEWRRTGAAVGSVAAMLGGCSLAPTGPDPSVSSVGSQSPPLSNQNEPVKQNPQIYSAVINQLIHVDRTFGSVSDPFGRVFVLDGVTARSSNPQFEVDGERFSEQARREIIAEVDDDPPVQFISNLQQEADPDRQGRTGVRDDGAIVGLGEIEYNDDDTVTVGAGMWCGIDCGFGATYVLDDVDGQWIVTGHQGPISIS